MLSFQAELYRAIFPHHIAQSRTVLISRADDIRPYSSNRANGFLQRSYGKLFPQSYPHNRGLRKICRSKAWGSVNEGAHFVCVTDSQVLTTQLRRIFPQSDHSMRDMAMAFILTV